MAAAVVAVFFLTKSKKNVDEDTTAPDTTVQTYLIDGLVPYYKNVPVSPYDNTLFKKQENGRIIYDDKNVKSSAGIDVSHFQGDIDFNKVKNDGIDFVFVRLGYRGYGQTGILGKDDKALENVKKAKAAGLKVGAYFYSQAISEAEAKEEADYAVQILEGEKLDYPLVFDWENDSEVGMRTDNVTKDELTLYTKAFCNEIEALGYKPMIYMNRKEGYMRFDLAKLTDYPIWFAQLSGDYPDFYYDFDIWQYTTTGKVDGIEGNVDLDLCFLDY